MVKGIFKLTTFIFLGLNIGCSSAQTTDNKVLRFMFYNVENFFDTDDDPTKNDNEFTPEGSMHWTKSKYLAKKDAIFRVIANVGEWEPPAIVGLCEVENRKV
ncbi:MAG: endonuclease, partial [Bacteroidales bacterium]|nr:endonuclease [Bacteroidales bacterium]